MKCFILKLVILIHSRARVYFTKHVTDFPSLGTSDRFLRHLDEGSIERTSVSAVAVDCGGGSIRGGRDVLRCARACIILVMGRRDASDGGRHMLRRLLGEDKMGHTKAWKAGCSGTSGVMVLVCQGWTLD